MFKKKIINPLNKKYIIQIYYGERLQQHALRCIKGGSFIIYRKGALKSDFRTYDMENLRYNKLGIRVCIKRK